MNNADYVREKNHEEELPRLGGGGKKRNANVVGNSQILQGKRKKRTTNFGGKPLNTTGSGAWEPG